MTEASKPTTQPTAYRAKPPHPARRSSDQLAEVFIAALGHDLRNPLSSISMVAALLYRRAESESATNLLRLIRNSSEELGRTIDQLVDFARLGWGQGIELTLQEVDLDKVCREVVRESEGKHQGGIRIETTGDAVGIWDLTRVTQIMRTLGDNAYGHSRADTAPTLRIDGSEPNSVTIAFWNDDLIPADRLDRLFEPDVGEGAGPRLGLFISQELAKAHGGLIVVESTETTGTTFVVQLPRHRS